MGKRRKRLTLPKYAKKYAKKRAALFGNKVEPVEEEIIQVTEPEPTPEPTPTPVIEGKAKPEQKPSRPNALKEVNTEEPRVKKEVVKKTRTRRTRKKAQPKKTTEE